MADLAHLDPAAATRAEIVDVINAVAQAVEIIADRVQMLFDVLELDDSPWREIVDLPDIATYQPEEEPCT